MTITIPSLENQEELLVLWEASVRATHDFLKEADIQVYKKLIGDKYLQSLDLYCILKEHRIAGFIGLQGELIQMLFVHPDFMKQGLGRTLVNFAVLEHHVTEVDVNEQNTSALAFYRNLGFEPFDRFESDDAGKPFPILSLSLAITH
ncbi:MAG: GNAT family N-acetyltransferase [Pedobacter sp.]